MKVGSIILVGVLVVVGLFGAGLWSAYNSGNRMEENIKATYDDNRNILSQYSTAIAEAAQIPAMQRDDLIKVAEAALEARYGADGAQAVFQSIQEQNPQIDSSVYTKLQQIIQAGRKDFETGQRKLREQVRIYSTALGSFPKGAMMKMVGYPSISLSDYDIVSDARTEEAFGTKVQEPIQIR